METPRDKTYRAACNQLAEQMFWIGSKIAKHVESPIEQAMAEALFLKLFTNGMNPFIHYSSIEPITARDGEYLIILQQCESGYRVDLALVCGLSVPPIKIAIECDGHDFHEKTKVQAARDKMRDRVLSLKFDAILRFTGSEIFNNAWGCAEQVEEVMVSVWRRRNETEHAATQPTTA